jgi:hypothetical protein
MVRFCRTLCTREPANGLRVAAGRGPEHDDTFICGTVRGEAPSAGVKEDEPRLVRRQYRAVELSGAECPAHPVGRDDGLYQ